MIPRHRIAPLAALLLGLGMGPLTGQTPGDREVRRVQVTRPQLEALVARLDSVAQSRAASGDQQVQARRDAARFRQRLAGGHFQPGDRGLVRVRGEAQPTKNARLAGLVVKRREGEEWKGAALQQARAGGRTLDELGIRWGDLLLVPRHGDAARPVPLTAALVTIPATIFALTRLIH